MLTYERNTMYRGLFDVYGEDGNCLALCLIQERAKLFAAAPELLEACKTAENWLQHLVQRTNADTFGFNINTLLADLTVLKAVIGRASTISKEAT